MTKAPRIHAVNIRLKQTGFDNVSAMLPPLPEGGALAAVASAPAIIIKC